MITHSLITTKIEIRSYSMSVSVYLDSDNFSFIEEFSPPKIYFYEKNLLNKRL
jgi:hypothetical protein